jgi:integrase
LYFKLLNGGDFLELTYPITDKEKLSGMANYLYNKSMRDYVLFEIGINLGIRITDFTKQKVGFYRVACEQGFVQMVPTKTQRYKKQIRVYISDDLNSLISEYIKGRNDEEWMFPSRKGGTAITRQQIHRIITEAAESVVIKETIGCHGLRKTFGYWHYQYNKDIRLLMEIFNHSSEEVTLRYIGVSDEQKKDSMKNMKLGIIRKGE